MRFQKVHATAFGPLRGKELEFAPGLNVVHGPNEAGKSSWLSATYAALCGVRRGRGASTLEDREFAARHRPWEGTQWKASCVVVLDDGRRIKVRQDLEGKVDSAVTDVGRGTDLSSTLMFEGSPDGSRLLGLDRKAMAAVAVVRQGQILEVTENVDALARHLERAAATAGVDETATAALAAIDTYRHDTIGSDRARTKPLAVSRDEVGAARTRLDAAQLAHHAWLDRFADVEDLDRQATEAHDEVVGAELALAHLKAREAAAAATAAQDQLTRVRQLAERVPQEPPAAPTDADLADLVDEALAAWDNRPDEVALQGAAATELAGHLAQLPVRPEGDLEPAPSVRAARSARMEAKARLDAHMASAPVPVARPDTGGATDVELLSAAQALESPVPTADPALAAEVESLTHAEPSRPSLVVPGVAAAVGVVVAVAGLAVGQPIVVVVGLIGLVVAGVLFKRAKPDTAALEAHRQEARYRLESAQRATAEAQARVDGTRSWVQERGLQPDPFALRSLATSLQRSASAAHDAQRWQQRGAELDTAVARSRAALAQALAERGVPVASIDDVTLDDADAAYDLGCQERRLVADQSAGREGMEAALAHRCAAEEAAQAAATARARAEETLRNAADGASVANAATAGPDMLVAELRRWKADRADQLRALAVARQTWAELQGLLDGRALDEVAAWAEAAVGERDARRRACGDRSDPGTDLGPDPEATLRRLRAEAASRQDEATGARATYDTEGVALHSVPDAEESLASAVANNEALEVAARVLDIARTFLAEAQDRVHRDIAPILAAKVSERLSLVTGGRYSELAVEPETLAVQVVDSGGAFRPAGLLSHGTAEQVYLLLRVAMVEILTSNGESCPLLLDDPTVHADAIRTTRLLEVVQQVSDDHQVILFTQEAEVLAWASTHLRPETDKLIQLAGR